MSRVNGLALVTAAAAVLTAALYVRLNPTPTRFTLGFLVGIALAAVFAGVVPSRLVSIVLLAAVTVACIGFGSLTPSVFGILFWAIGIVAGVGLGRLQPGGASGAEQAATLGGALLGLLVPVGVVLSWVR